MGLREYRRKRDFTITREPPPAGGRVGSRRRPRLSYVIQHHFASREHYDFRLELDGVLKSWAVPKGPGTAPADRRLAVEVEDHPLEYGSFEGTIPEGQYGAGEVLIWDRGTWAPLGDPQEGLARGALDFTLSGRKLKGAWTLVRMKGAPSSRRNWLLIKRTDRPRAASPKTARRARAK